MIRHFSIRQHNASPRSRRAAFLGQRSSDLASIVRLNNPRLTMLRHCRNQLLRQPSLPTISMSPQCRIGYNEALRTTPRRRWPEAEEPTLFLAHARCC